MNKWRTVWPEAVPVACPKCGAQPDEPCRVVGSSLLKATDPHSARIKAGQRLAEHKGPDA